MEQPSPEPQPIPEISPEELQAFRERFSASLEESLDFFDGEDFLILQPMDLHIEDDERIMDELQ
ncbi:MAG TPA: hypothetical protein PLS49_01395, partial [Candidatus Woesebacteria bacterium]|nr:hypothetical protein [Candidatus Woesebacteria bacterium]